jgi:hypothetical protein
MNIMVRTGVRSGFTFRGRRGPQKILKHHSSICDGATISAVADIDFERMFDAAATLM